jgi:transposase
MNQIRAFLIEQGITIRKSVAAVRTSLQAILDNRDNVMSLRMRKLILALQQDWIWTDKRIEMTTSETKSVSLSEASCQRLMTIPGIGPIISTAVVATVGIGEAYDCGCGLRSGSGLCRANIAWVDGRFCGASRNAVVDICACCLCRRRRST